ncbi:MAG TPA: transcription antitermination factor NusB [Actinomycetes bacterium]|jgi:N utilization substance protein B
MAARSKARRRALDVLFEADQRSVPAADVLAARVALADPPVHEHTARLVEGVVQNRERIDGLIETYAEDWPLDRLPAVDRALLRISVYELLYVDDVPDHVVIDEAVELAKQLSTDDSPAFVNGLLARILSLKPMLAGSAEQ